MGPLGHNYYCETVTPPSAIPNGAGALCYSSATACEQGPNSCVSGLCTHQPTICSSGQAASSPANTWFCRADLPALALPNSAGTYCYQSLAGCFTGAIRPTDAETFLTHFELNRPKWLQQQPPLPLVAGGLFDRPRW